MTEPRNRVVQVRRFGDADGLEASLRRPPFVMGYDVVGEFDHSAMACATFESATAWPI